MNTHLIEALLAAAVVLLTASLLLLLVGVRDVAGDADGVLVRRAEADR